MDFCIEWIDWYSLISSLADTNIKSYGAGSRLDTLYAHKTNPIGTSHESNACKIESYSRLGKFSASRYDSSHPSTDLSLFWASRPAGSSVELWKSWREPTIQGCFASKGSRWCRLKWSSWGWGKTQTHKKINIYRFYFWWVWILTLLIVPKLPVILRSAVLFVSRCLLSSPLRSRKEMRKLCTEERGRCRLELSVDKG